MRVAIVACLVAMGCGGSSKGTSVDAQRSPDLPFGGDASCTTTEITSVGTLTRTSVSCMEIQGLSADDVAVFRAACNMPPADGSIYVTTTSVYGPNSCSRTNAVGGCLITFGSFPETAWYYADGNQTLDLVKQECAGMNGTVVLP